MNRTRVGGLMAATATVSLLAGCGTDAAKSEFGGDLNGSLPMDGTSIVEGEWAITGGGSLGASGLNVVITGRNGAPLPSGVRGVAIDGADGHRFVFGGVNTKGFASAQAPLCDANADARALTVVLVTDHGRDMAIGRFPTAGPPEPARGASCATLHPPVL